LPGFFVGDDGTCGKPHADGEAHRSTGRGHNKINAVGRPDDREAVRKALAGDGPTSY
jgi:hypothetical protein